MARKAGSSSNDGRRISDLGASPQNLVAEGTLIKGRIHGAGSLEVQGTIGGNCSLKGTLLVHRSGCVMGSVEAANVIVEGEVKGDIRADERIELRASCKVTGDLTGASIVIADGCFFEGAITMRGAGREQGPVSFTEKRNAEG